MSTATGNLLAPGHTACSGCGEALGMKLLIDAIGPDTIVANATGCSEIFTSRYPQSAWEVPWIHSLFENASAVASGVEAALKAKGKKEGITVVNMGGDGAMADIGFGALSGMLERGHDVLAICLDNEAYMNTGIQRSSLTPFNASTTTSPAGKISWGKAVVKKDLAAIVAAHHGVRYVATAVPGYHKDLERKIKRAKELEGPKFILILVPCPLGWRFPSHLTIKVSKLAVQTGLFPLYEMEDGKVTKVMTLAKKTPVEEYLKLQGRFKHLFTRPGGEKEIAKIQAIADSNIEKLGLMKS